MMRDAKSPAMTAAALLLVRVTAGVCLLPLLLQLPTTLGIGFGTLAALVMLLAWPRQHAVSLLLRLPLAGAALLAAAWVLPGIGRDTACAVLAAMLAVKPAETFSLRDGRSLVGFALFAPFATFLLDQGPISLLLALLAVLLALLALQRLAADEGEIISTPHAAFPRWPILRQVLHLLALGLPLALATFWLFPRLPTPLWGLPQRSAATTGLSDTMAPGSMFDTLLDDSPAARATFQGPPPPQQQMYWRGPTLWDFDGKTWRQAHGLQRFDAPHMRPENAGWRYLLELEPTDDRQLIALDLPTAAPEGAHLGRDFTLLAAQAQFNVSRWQLHSAPPAEVEAELPPPLRARALLLPQGFNPRTLALGRQWRHEAGQDAAGRSDLAIAQRAMRMIHSSFAYTMNVPLAGRNEVDDFLFDRKQGYCEHFSSAFVVLMRAAGIPARVVTGYAGAYRNPVGNYWLIRKSDAHAWAEIWLPTRGWVRFDPTAAVAPERVYDTVADRQPGRIGNFDGLVPLFNAGDWLRRGWNDFVLGFNAQRQLQLLKPLGLDRYGPTALVLLFALLSGIAMAWMVLRIARGERQRDPLLRAWHQLEARYRKLGRGRAAHEPAQVWAARVAADTPQAGTHLALLAKRVSNVRYGGKDDPQLIAALRKHRP